MDKHINMKVGAEVGLGPGHIVLDREPLERRKAATLFSAPVYCGQLTVAHLSYC